MQPFMMDVPIYEPSNDSDLRRPGLRKHELLLADGTVVDQDIERLFPELVKRHRDQQEFEALWARSKEAGARKRKEQRAARARKARANMPVCEAAPSGLKRKTEDDEGEEFVRKARTLTVSATQAERDAEEHMRRFPELITPPETPGVEVLKNKRKSKAEGDIRGEAMNANSEDESTTPRLDEAPEEDEPTMVSYKGRNGTVDFGNDYNDISFSATESTGPSSSTTLCTNADIITLQQSEENAAETTLHIHTKQGTHTMGFLSAARAAQEMEVVVQFLQTVAQYDGRDIPLITGSGPNPGSTNPTTKQIAPPPPSTDISPLSGNIRPEGCLLDSEMLTRSTHKSGADSLEVLTKPQLKVWLTWHGRHESLSNKNKATHVERCREVLALIKTGQKVGDSEVETQAQLLSMSVENVRNGTTYDKMQRLGRT